MLEVQDDVRPEERRGTLSAFLTLFGILAAHTVLETARDALFLARLPPSQLPWVYLAMAGVAVGLSQVRWRAGRSFVGSAQLSALLAGCSAVTFGFWLAGGWTHPWMLRALYIWTGLVGTLAGLQFWLVLGELYTISQAKRLYRVIGLGSLLGAVAGAGVARLASASFPAEQLVLVAAVLLAVTAVGPALLLRSSSHAALRSADRRTSAAEAIRFLRDQPYLTRLAGFVLLSTVALTLADYVFKSNVARHVPAADLGTFFATFYMVLNLLALAAQLFLMGWLLRVAGLHRSLWLLPALLSVGAAGVAFGGGLVAALLLKGADGTLRHSLHRTTTELLFLPIPDSLRARAKPVIDVVGQRGGQALASIFILGEISMGRGDTVLAAATALLGIVWVVWAAELRPHYVEVFRRALRQGALKDRVDLPELDLGSLEALMAALNSADDGEVTAGLDLLETEGRARLVPALILYHPSPPVVLRALRLFEKSGRKDFVPIADRLFGHPDAEVRAAALRARVAADPDRGRLEAGLQDPSPLVRATALVGLIAHHWAPGSASESLDELMASGSPEARVALVLAIERRPAEMFEDALVRLAGDDLAEVRRHAAHAMQALPRERFLPTLVAMLASRETRADARAALLSYGPTALRRLASALADPEVPRETRRELPRAIALFNPTNASRVLLHHLPAEADGHVRFRVIKALGRIGADHPEVAFDPRPLVEATGRTVAAALRLVHWSLILSRGPAEDRRRATPGYELLLTLCADKRTHAVERVLRLLALQYRGEDFKQIHRGLRSPQAKVRSSSRELLENLLEPPLRDGVLALVDDVPEGTRLLRGRAYYRPSPLGYEELLALLLDQTSETVRCIAAYHIAELDLKAFRPRLEALDPGRAGFFAARVIESALRLLSATPGRLANA